MRNRRKCRMLCRVQRTNSYRNLRIPASTSPANLTVQRRIANMELAGAGRMMPEQMRLRTRMILVLALLALLTGSLAQAAAAPATTTAAAQPATARAVADLSTPKASAVSLFAAIG